MAKVVAFVKKVVAFAKSPQGKRDWALVCTAAGTVVALVKQFH